MNLNPSDADEDLSVREILTATMSAEHGSTKRQKAEEAVGLAGLSNDLVVGLASYLDARELGASFALVCKRFGTKQARDDDDDDDGAQTLAEQAAWQSFQQGASDEERACLPAHDGESPLSLLRELQRLRARLSFDQLLGKGISYPNPDDLTLCPQPPGRGSLERSTVIIDTGCSESTVISDHVMRAGKHFVTFKGIGSHEDLSIGIVRPMKGLANQLDSVQYFYPLFILNDAVQDTVSRYRNDSWGNSVIGYLFNVPNPLAYNIQATYNWNDIASSSWHGESIKEPCTSIGRYNPNLDASSLLLDLDRGELLLYQGGKLCGKIVSGIQGIFCWAAVVRGHGLIREAHISIERGD